MINKSKTQNINNECKVIQVEGLVQGVGFRPFIYRLAKQYQLKGFVENRSNCVFIKIQGNPKNIEQFISSIKSKAPVVSKIKSVVSRISEKENFKDFTIVKSKDFTDKVSEISPDIAVCKECLQDMKVQKNRINYPFINCTNCGPRFSIINDFPYDREKTTMKNFSMCEKCQKEYDDVSDRRFHAQPVACSVCGPHYELVLKNENFKEINLITDKVAEFITAGKIVAIKGIGGFFIACDAFNEQTVKHLRKLKNRESKPFAVMFSSLEKLKIYAEVNNLQEEVLQSWQRPILLIEQKKNYFSSVNAGLKTIGAMLPYMPFHHLLFEKLKTDAIVLTSGNFSDEPIIIDNKKAIEKLSKISDAVLIYNRDIYNRSDDSVVMIANDKIRISRRSRGYAPSPIHLNFSAEGILATGAEMKNCFCIGKGKQAIMSQHIGELTNFENYEFYCETIERFKQLFRISPSLITCDMHPDYLSTKYADNSGLEKIRIQHHHAHIASCMAENILDEKIIGVSFDGTGFGTDGNIWGGEFFICDLVDFERYAHFDYIPLPGGDKATKEPWRTGVSYLYKIFGADFLKLDFPFIDFIKEKNVELIIKAIDKKINCPLTSSAGRLFDTVAAIINFCTISTFEAEAPIRLESILDESCKEKYSFTKGKTISFDLTIKEIIKDIKSGVSNPVISSKFHNTIIFVILEVSNEIRKKYNLNKIVLSGGTFQNKYILENVEKLLIKNKYQVFTHSKIPTNDGGIALGQLAIAAKRRKLKCV